jgi:hypothetical protein
MFFFPGIYFVTNEQAPTWKIFCFADNKPRVENFGLKNLPCPVLQYMKIFFSDLQNKQSCHEIYLGLYL